MKYLKTYEKFEDNEELARFMSGDMVYFPPPQGWLIRPEIEIISLTPPGAKKYSYLKSSYDKLHHDIQYLAKAYLSDSKSFITFQVADKSIKRKLTSDEESQFKLEVELDEETTKYNI